MESPSHPPVIVKHPQNQTGIYGDEITFTVSATGSGLLSYQWMKDGKAITNENSFVHYFDTPTLHIHSFSPECKGSYSCVVSSSIGSVISRSAEIKGVLK